MKVQVLNDESETFRVLLVDNGNHYPLQKLAKMEDALELVNSIIMAFGWTVEWLVSKHSQGTR